MSEGKKVIRTVPEQEPKNGSNDMYLDIEDDKGMVMLSYHLTEKQLENITGYEVGSEVLNHIVNDSVLYAKIEQAINDAVEKAVVSYIMD